MSAPESGGGAPERGRGAGGRSRRARADAPDQGPRPLSDLASAALRRMAGEGRADLMEVLKVWADAVGARVAEVARPTHLAQGILTLSVVSPVWAQQLRLMAPELTGKLNAELGKEMVRELRFSPARDTQR